MKYLFKTFNPTFNHNKMKTKKALIKKFIFALSFLGTISFSQNKVNAQTSPICPDPSTTSITSIYDESDSNSFFALTDGQGYCRSTPDKYGVTVFKMGFCKKNPGNPTGSDIKYSELPDYSSCTWAFESTTGAIADFSAGGSIDLPEAGSSDPAAGTYPHGVMIISNTFRIKGKYGPVAGETFYSTDRFGESATDISSWGTTPAPLTSFSGPNECTAATEGEVVVGGTISGYLLDSNGIMQTNTPEKTGAPCAGTEKLLGVMNMANNLTISDTTKGLKMTFIVSSNGMSVSTNSNEAWPPTELNMSSGPFSVTFETF